MISSVLFTLVFDGIREITEPKGMYEQNEIE
jgi:hypothetical protein